MTAPISPVWIAGRSHQGRCLGTEAGAPPPGPWAFSG